MDSYVCDLCDEPVGEDRALVLRPDGVEVERHPDCHAFGEGRH